MRYLLTPLLFFVLSSPPLLAAAPQEKKGRQSDTSVLQECRKAGQRMLENQVGVLGELALTGVNSKNPQVSSLHDQTFIDGIGKVGSQQGSYEFTFRCIRNQGSGKTTFTYNNMQFHSPLGSGVIDPISAAGAERNPLR